MAERSSNVVKTVTSGALAVASVTAVLKNILGNGMVLYAEAAGLGDVSVTALPPDRITTGAEERTQLNVFLYRIGSHTSVSKNTLRGSSGQPSMSLELWYLLTASGAEDLHAELLLGCAMQLLQDIPLLTPDRIRT